MHKELNNQLVFLKSVKNECKSDTALRIIVSRVPKLTISRGCGKLRMVSG